MKIEIVSHCWHYASQLTYQLSSLLLHPLTGAHVKMTVFYCDVDPATSEVRKFFEAQSIDRVTWSWYSLPKEQLFRRSIGRNIAAERTAADWVWFADVDMCFRRGCLDRLAEIAAGTPSDLIFPRTIQISATHAIGDATLDKVAARPRIVDIEPTEFVTHRYARAIGGVQIVRGDVARRIGYNRDSAQHQQPLARWQRTHDDVAFRRSLGTGGEAVDLPEVYRIRHGRHGRKDEFGQLQQRTSV